MLHKTFARYTALKELGERIAGYLKTDAAMEFRNDILRLQGSASTLLGSFDEKLEFQEDKEYGRVKQAIADLAGPVADQAGPSGITSTGNEPGVGSVQPTSVEVARARVAKLMDEVMQKLAQRTSAAAGAPKSPAGAPKSPAAGVKKGKGKGKKQAKGKGKEQEEEGGEDGEGVDEGEEEEEEEEEGGKQADPKGTPPKGSGGGDRGDRKRKGPDSPSGTGTGGGRLTRRTRVSSAMACLPDEGCGM